jgi:hypothetical protein
MEGGKNKERENNHKPVGVGCDATATGTGVMLAGPLLDVAGPSTSSMSTRWGLRASSSEGTDASSSASESGCEQATSKGEGMKWVLGDGGGGGGMEWVLGDGGEGEGGDGGEGGAPLLDSSSSTSVMKVDPDPWGSATGARIQQP